jgi:hypothetical protein
LPEPIPTADVPQARLDELVESIRNRTECSPNVESPLFKACKKEVFLRQCTGLSVEQAMAQFETVFETGLDRASIRITLDDVRVLAKEIGEKATPGIVEDALAETRLFRRWLHDVIKVIADRHFADDDGDEAATDILLDVAHLDLPAEHEDRSRLVINIPSVWDAENEEHRIQTFVLNVGWPGRHAIRLAWVEYIMGVMRTICALRI